MPTVQGNDCLPWSVIANDEVLVQLAEDYNHIETIRKALRQPEQVVFDAQTVVKDLINNRVNELKEQYYK